MNSTNLKLIFCVNFQCEHLTCLNIWFYNLNKFFNDVKWCFFDLNECQMLISLSNENVRLNHPVNLTWVLNEQLFWVWVWPTTKRPTHRHTFKFTSNKFKHTIFLWFKNKKDVWGTQLPSIWCVCMFWVTQYEVDSNEVQLWVEQHSCLATLCCATFYSTNQQHYDDSVLITIC